MAEPKQKDVVDIAIDFFFGALFVDVAYGLSFLRSSGPSWHWQWHTVLIVLFALTMISGSLAALFRNQFWSAYETYSNIPADGRNRLARGQGDPLDALCPRLRVAWIAVCLVREGPPFRR